MRRFGNNAFMRSAQAVCRERSCDAQLLASQLDLLTTNLLFIMYAIIKSTKLLYVDLFQ